jgi:2-polyprenyl-6-methoxyphenol hydroxylase-like FAD-dependent oxidoreductase
MTGDCSVLIVGAGPTGLVLAIWLTQIGVKVRIIDKEAEPGATSRALVVHARTLEFYRQLGLDQKLLQEATTFPAVNLWVERKPKAHISLLAAGEGISPFPYVVIYPQDKHEVLLIKHLRTLGVEVERSVQLLDFETRGERVHSRLRLGSGEREVVSDYLVGCDGAHSTVRDKLKTGFEGTTYPDLFYVADIVGTGPALNGEFHGALDKSQFLAIFPMKDKGHARLIGVIREKDDGTKIEWNDVNQTLLEAMDIDVREVRWFSSYHVHHRLASHFQMGRVFLAGDAAHIHSPVGGQGMNTGIGDAVNLAWKLGQVIDGKASKNLLKSFEEERIAFARRLVSSTDQAFRMISSNGLIARFIRTKIVPIVLPFALSFEAVRRLMFMTVSQTGITYRGLSLNQGDAGSLRAGDRLPWIESVDNFLALNSLTWQIHIYEESPVPTPDLPIKTIRFTWNEEMKAKGLRSDQFYVIRPDGYIGMICSLDDIDDLLTYLSSFSH